MKLNYAMIFMLATVVHAQTEVKVKDTPASTTLVQLAKSQVQDQKEASDKFQQARTMLDQTTKDLSGKIQAIQKELQDQLQKDKKYKPMLDQIDALNKQLDTARQNAQQQYSKDTGSIQQKLSSETAQVQGLIPVVRKENDLPDTATFDLNTQKWTVPAAAKK